MIDIERMAAFMQTDQYEQAVQIVGKLLTCWCIPRSKDKESQLDYDFISRNRSIIEDILKISGHTLTFVSTLGREMAYITGPTPATMMKLPKADTTVLLCLRMKYEESMRSVTQNDRNLVADVFVEDLFMLVNTYKKPPKMNLDTLYTILNKFEGLNIVRIATAKNKFNKETIITILPSVTALLPSATTEDIHSKLMTYKMETNRRTIIRTDNVTPEDEEE